MYNIQSNKLHKATNVLITLLAFAVPIFFLPLTTEFFEFNKLTLLAIVTAVTLTLWGIDVFVSKKLSIARSEINVPILLFIAVTLASSIFSVNKYVSVFGSYGRWFPSLVGVTTLGVLYYIIAANVNTKESIRRVLTALTAGTTLSSLIAVLNYYGIYLGDQPYLQSKWFTTTGSGTNTVILALVGFLVGLALYMNVRKTVTRVIIGAGLTVNLFYIALVNWTPVWVLLFAGVIVTLLTIPSEKLKADKGPILALKGVLLAIVVIMFIPVTRAKLVDVSYIREIQLPARASWIVASSTLRDFPILGTGPSTFYLNYPRYKPVTMNNTNEWNIRFDKPFNEVFNVVGTMGILGILAASFVAVKIVRVGLKTRKVDELSIGLTTSLIAVATMLLFSYATVSGIFVLVMLLGLAVASISMNAPGTTGYLNVTSTASINTLGGTETSDTEVFRVVIAAPFVALALAGLFSVYKAYPSEYYMRKAAEAMRANDGNATYQYQTKAINHSPQNDVYHNTYAQTSIALARSLAARGEELTDTDRETIQVLISQAIRSTKAATEILNPLNASGWEVRANVYRALIGSAEDAETWTMGALNTAIQLDPTNPRLRLDLGGVYYSKEDYLTAANLFRQGTDLKPDYVNAYYNFGQALIGLENYVNAKGVFEVAQRMVELDSPDYKILAQEIEKLNAMPEVAGAQAEKPTISELEQGNETAPETTEQEPLVNEGEALVEETSENEVLPEAVESEEEETEESPEEPKED